MDASPSLAERLFPFLDSLRRHGYRVGADQYLAVRDLLLLLERAGTLPETVESLCFTLGPLLCSTPDQQTSLFALFTAWLPNDAVWAARFEKPEVHAPAPVAEAIPAPPAERSLTKWLLVAGLTSLVMLGIYGALNIWLIDFDPVEVPKDSNTWIAPEAMQGTVYRDVTKAEPLANAQVQFLGQTVTADATGSYKMTLDPQASEWAGSVLLSHPDFPDPARFYVDLKTSPATQDFYMAAPQDQAASLESLREEVDRLNALVDRLETPELSAVNEFWNGNLWALRLLLIGVFTLVWLLLVHRSWRSYRDLRRDTLATAPESPPLRVARTPVSLFTGKTWQWALQALRRPQWVPSLSLDVPASVQATVMKGGLFTPIFGAMKRSPSYLILLQRQGLDDHVYRMADAWVARLRRLGADVDVYAFRGSPQLLETTGKQRESNNLAQVAGRHPHHRLLVFIDPAQCFSPLDNQPQPWLALLQRWPQRAVLTPYSPANDAAMVQRLRHRGFQVVGLNPDALANLETVFQESDAPPSHRPQADPLPPLPSMLARDARPWLRPAAPPAAEVTRLLQHLRGYLDQAEWRWFRACAVAFPVLHWELTVFLGQKLTWDGQPVFSEKSLQKLAALPWFREGQIPLWLRQRLVEELNQAEKKTLHQLLAEWLKTPEDARNIIGLFLTEPPTKSTVAKLPDTRYNDSVLLTLGEGTGSTPIGIRLPKFFRHLLYRQGNPLLGLRVMPVWVLMILMVLGWVRSYYPPVLESYVPRIYLIQIHMDPSTFEPSDQGTLFSLGVSQRTWEVYRSRWANGLEEGKSQDLQSYRVALNKTLVENNLKHLSESLFFQARERGQILLVPEEVVKAVNQKSEISIVGESVIAGQKATFVLGNLPVFYFSEWFFGDGKSEISGDEFSPIAQNSHQYLTQGVYYLKVAVTTFKMERESLDPAGQYSLTRIIQVKAPPEAGEVQIFREGGLEIPMVWCPPGTFLMGSPESEKERDPDETQHRVTLNQGFWLGQTEVTQEQWNAVMDSNPSYFKGDTLPVDGVSWIDATEFIKRLNAKLGKELYRLPTEAEWEYACRAGTTTPFHTGENLTTDQANYDGRYPYADFPKGEYREKTTPVGSFPGNAWGLQDMHGNLWEWCQDWLGDYAAGEQVNPGGPDSGQFRVLRGGSWDDDGSYCRSADRGGLTPGLTPDYRGVNSGFRLARGQKEPEAGNR